MKKKQWYVFVVFFFLISIVYYASSKNPSIYASQINSLSDLGFWIDNKIEHSIATVSLALGLACLFCSDRAEN